MVKPTTLGYYFYKVDMHAVKKYNYITITAQVLEPGLHYPSVCDCSLDSVADTSRNIRGAKFSTCMPSVSV